jgi:hypothetical protein
MSERPVILLRRHGVSDEEIKAMEHFFLVLESRLNIEKGDLVVGRYSVLPFYTEQERDIRITGARLINTKAQHDYVADLGNWIGDFAGLTPKTWGPGEYADLPEDMSFVLKGQTNSKKFLWNTHMFAKSKRDVPDVLRRLLDDSLLSEQKIYVRQYVPLEILDYGLNGLPITREMRFFVANKKIVSGAFYWSSHAEYLTSKGVKLPTAEDVPRSLTERIVATIGDKVPFYAFDVAQTTEGEWILIELNDGQMSGLSENPPYLFYRNLLESFL